MLAPLSRIGDSINVSGCCLTVVAVRGGTLAFEVVPETLRRTALGGLAAGRAGEPRGRAARGRALRRPHRAGPRGRRGGAASSAARRASACGCASARPSNVQRYLIEKGSVTVAGVSLTVAELHDDGFAVAIVPHTLQVTTFGTLAVGDPVNLEADMIARYVERLLAAAPHPADSLPGVQAPRAPAPV